MVDEKFYEAVANVEAGPVPPKVLAGGNLIVETPTTVNVPPPVKKVKELKKDKKFRVKVRASTDFPTRDFEITFNPNKLTMRKMGIRNAPCLSVSWRQLVGILYVGSGEV